MPSARSWVAWTLFRQAMNHLFKFDRKSVRVAKPQEVSYTYGFLLLQTFAGCFKVAGTLRGSSAGYGTWMKDVSLTEWLAKK